MEFEKLSLVFMFICIIALFVENKNIRNDMNQNLEHMEPSSGSNGAVAPSSNSNLDTIRDLIRQEYNHDIEAIRNLGAISKSLLTGKNYHNTSPDSGNEGDLTIPANVQIQGNLKTNGWAVAVPIGTIIMWSLETPPLPNTTRYDYTTLDSYTLADTDCWYPCIGGANQLNIPIPDLRGRMPVGQGRLSGTNEGKHIFPTLRAKTMGRVPVGLHTHRVNDASANHTHVGHIRYNDVGHMGSPRRSASFDGSALTDRGSQMSFNGNPVGGSQTTLPATITV